MNFVETESEIIINCSVMAAGVYNGKLKTAEELQRSVKWWTGKEIVIENRDEINDHPKTGIVTAKTIKVGQLFNLTWDNQALKINAEAHFYKDLTPSWLQDDLRKGKRLGVSGAYYCDFIQQNGEVNGRKYDAIEMNYQPNNLAIVKKPACKTPVCGLNLNEGQLSLDEKEELQNKILEELAIIRMHPSLEEVRKLL